MKMKLLKGIMALGLAGMACASFAAGDTGQVTVSKVKVSSDYVEVQLELPGINSDGCDSSASVVVLSAHPSKSAIYASAMAAMNAKLSASFEVDGCSNAVSSVTLPIVKSITVGE